MRQLEQIPPGEILELFGNALDSQVAYVGSDLHYRFANDAYHAFQGKPTSLIRGKTMLEVLGKDVFSVLKPHIDAVLDGEEQNFEIPRRHPVTGLRQILYRMIPDLQPDGAVNGFLEILRDVTEGKRRKQVSEAEEAERQRVERAIAASEKRFRTMVDQSPLSTQIFDANGKCTQANVAWQRLWCSDIEDIQHFNLLKDPQLVELGLHSAILKAYSGEHVEIPAFEFDPAKSDMTGRKRWVKAMLYPITADGSVSEVVMVLQDLTEEKLYQQELQLIKERLQLIVNTALDAVVTIDGDGVVTAWDGQAAKIFGWTRAEALGLKLEDLILPEDAREEFGSFHELVTEAGSSIEVELTALRKTGQLFPVEAAISAAKQGEEKFYSLFLRDISERKGDQEKLKELNAQLQQRVEERTEQLEKASHDLQDFTYSVAHDLRNPLRRLTGMAAVLQQDFSSGLSSDAQELLDQIRGFAKDMARIIEDHIEFARLAEPRIRFDRVDVSSLVWGVIRKLEPEYPAAQFKVRILPSLRITADPDLLEVVFENLLDNAAKFSQDRSIPAVEVGTYVDEGVRLFYVRDNGIGFDPSFGSKLFDPFIRLHREVEYGGTGVGLANVLRIVERHGGQIWAQGEEGKGALFTFTLAPSQLKG